MFDSETLLNHLRRTECYLENGHFKLVSGKHSDSYIQVRIAIMDPKARQAFAEAMAHMLTDLNPTALAASTIGGILLAVETSDRLGVPTLVGRQVAKAVTWVNPKELGAEALTNVVLIDDIVTTAGTLRAGIESVYQIGATVGGVAVAVDRSHGEGRIRVGEEVYETLSLIRISLNRWDPSNCPICPKPYVNLHNPEEDFLSVVLSMPSQMADQIISGYRKVYKLQRDNQQVEMIDEWEPWLPSLLAGLPLTRVGEDSGLAQFIRRFVSRKERSAVRRRVLTELVGHLLVLSNIRVEARSIGCSILIGDRKKLLHVFHADVPIEVPRGIKSTNLSELIPYYDALQETDAVFLFDKDGELFAIKRLVRLMESGEMRGIQLLRQVTEEWDAIGFVVRRERKALAVYREARLEAVAELSEKTGTWEFATPRAIVEEIDSLIPGIGQTIELVLEISREMVTRGYGGLFVIGDVPPTLQRQPPKTKVDVQPITSLGIGMLAEIAKLDGAVFVSKDGELQDASVIIVNVRDRTCVSDASITYTHLRTGGSRRETAYRTSKECPTVAVVCISQNGTVEIFVNGKSWPVSEAIAGVSR